MSNYKRLGLCIGFPGFPLLLTFLSFTVIPGILVLTLVSVIPCVLVIPGNFSMTGIPRILVIPCFACSQKEEVQEVQEVRERTERQESQKKQENMTPHGQLLNAAFATLAMFHFATFVLTIPVIFGISQIWQ